MMGWEMGGVRVVFVKQWFWWRRRITIQAMVYSATTRRKKGIYSRERILSGSGSGSG